jgi:uncharacterized membrane protein
MALIGRLHPLLIHFPIALVLAAGGAEAAATFTTNDRWRIVALHNVRIAAAFAIPAAFAGWRLAFDSGSDAPALLEWHRWLGTLAAAATLAAALATAPIRRRPAAAQWIYRIALLTAAALVAVAGHLGGALAWGPGFLHL